MMDQLTCHTTSLNLCSSLAVHVFPAGSSHVQMKTRPSYSGGVAEVKVLTFGPAGFIHKQSKEALKLFSLA